MAENLLAELQVLKLDDGEIFSLFRNVAAGWQKKSERVFEFNVNEVKNETNNLIQFATLEMNKHGKLKTIIPGVPLASVQSQQEFTNRVRSWLAGEHGKQVLLRPVWAQLPLKGALRWKDAFQIRPINQEVKIGKGLNFYDVVGLKGFGEEHLGPPYPFVLEVMLNKSDNLFLGYNQGIRLLTEYESLISVLLIQHITTARKLRDRRWTSIWNGAELSYHLLDGGFDLAEESMIDDFTANNGTAAPLYPSNNYYDHLFSQGKEIYLPHNIVELLEAFDALAKPARRAFLRACYWFSLGIESRQEHSLSQISFSNAIECLLPRQSKAKCKECGKSSVKGPNKLFNEHLEKYAPTIPSLKSMHNQIYSIRSALTHGSKLESIDVDRMSPLRQDHDNAFLLEFVARRALVNWLADPKRCDPTLPVDNK